MATPFVGEIKIVPFNFPPKNWAFCNGQVLAIAQNQALYSLLGTAYGGNGQTNFALPNFQGRAPIHFGSNSGTSYAIGAAGGEQNHTLSINELPNHTHTVMATTAAATNTATPDDPNTMLGASNPQPIYGPYSASTQLAQSAAGPGGGGQPHSNMQPYLTLNFIIALSGIYPSQN